MIRFDQVTKRFALPGGGEQVALHGLDLSVERGETLCLIGGSGSGKSTALRLINALETPSSGRVLVDGRDVAEQPPVQLRRSIGYVLQRGALFPHLNIRRNVGLLCELEGWDAETTAVRVDSLLELVRLDPRTYAERSPHELSGGEQQRVGVARALALDPPLVLLDEPFGALDPLTRRALQREFRDLSAGAERTSVFVTHDLDEAFRLGDRVALLQAGRLLQVGTPRELIDTPASDEVARFVAGFELAEVER